jgi:glycosyltransferase involved in cell wall biosynthesis
MRILVISPYFLPTIGGSQRYIEELYAHMIRQYPHVHVDVIAYNTEHALPRETHRGLTIHRIACLELIKGQFAIPNMFALWGKLIQMSRKDIAVVHTHIRFFDASWWTWIYAKMIGAKSIFTEQVAAHPVHTNPLVQWIAKTIDQTIARFSINHYDLVTTTNSAAKTFLEQTLNIHHPIIVSYGGVDTRYFSPVKTRTVPHISKRLPKHSVIVTFASRLIWSKGITYFIRTLKQMRLPTNVHVLVAGEGPLTSWIQNEIDTTPLKRVHFLGALNYKEMKTLLQATDIFVHPSHHNEGFPNVILEALASNCFVIATDNAGTKEMINHGKTGYLIRQKSIKGIGDALQFALSRTKERKLIAKSARKDMKTRFEWNSLSRSFYLLIQRFCVFESSTRHLTSLSYTS